MASKVISNIPRVHEYERLIEPTCGIGSFLEALLGNGIPVADIEDWEINPNYVVEDNNKLSALVGEKLAIVQQNFFTYDFSSLNLSKKRYLFLGNPPWVTNSKLGRLLSDFDISECIAFLIKTTVARKLFEYSCKKSLNVCDFLIKKIDAKKHFNVNVDACLFCASSTRQTINYSLSVYSDLEHEETDSMIDSGTDFKWRSGVKHDTSKIMEFIP